LTFFIPAVTLSILRFVPTRMLVSADLDELIGLSDRIVVMLRGELVSEEDPATVTPEDLGSAMTGAAREAG
ncbi:hypothetical protein ACFQ1S_32635, partial [Kibdelosporangium lantanae]